MKWLGNIPRINDCAFDGNLIEVRFAIGAAPALRGHGESNPFRGAPVSIKRQAIRVRASVASRRNNQDLD